MLGGSRIVFIVVVLWTLANMVEGKPLRQRGYHDRHGEWHVTRMSKSLFYVFPGEQIRVQNV